MHLDPVIFSCADFLAHGGGGGYRDDDDDAIPAAAMATNF
jgi:hypothetical protein